MQVTCPRCKATIEVEVTSFHPLRWGSNELSTIVNICLLIKDGTATVSDQGELSCPDFDAAVSAEVSP